jgi:hypothetical protein
VNCASDAPLDVKKVPLVLSGPTKLNGPFGSLLAAAWNRSVVFAEVEAVHERVVQVAMLPTAGFASFSEETKSPDGAKPASTYVLKL